MIHGINSEKIGNFSPNSQVNYRDVDLIVLVVL
jgi:hypothetical protein